MLTRRIKFIIIGLTICLGTVCWSGYNFVGKYKTLEMKMETTQKNLEQLQVNYKDIDNINNNLKNEKDELNTKIKELNEAYKDLQKEYERLNNLYQEEISPVSFNSNNLLASSNSTANKINKVLTNTGLQGLGSYYVEAEKTYGVNAIFLTALTAEESAWGNSNRARTQNNLSGFAVYSSSSSGATFSSKRESIMRTAKLLKEDYLNPSGKYHNGYTAYSVNIRYCPNDNSRWSNNIISIAQDLVKKINSL